MLTYADASVLSKKAAAPRAAGKEKHRDRLGLADKFHMLEASMLTYADVC